MKIVYVITGLEVGGAEIQLYNLLSVIKNNDEVELISISPKNTLLNRFLEKEISVRILPANNPKNLITLFKLITRKELDIVHSHMVHSNILVSLFSPFIHAKVITTSHNTHEGGILISYVWKMSLKFSKLKLMHVDVKSAKQLEAISRKNVYIYRNPIKKLSNRLPEKLPSRKWLVVASLTNQKNLGFAIQIFNQLGSDYSLDIYGSGPEYKRLKQLIESNISNVFLRGNIDDPYKVYSNYNGFLLTSTWEGLPVSLIEAMAHGLVVCVPNVGGIFTIFDEYKVDGLLMQNYDLDSWTDAIKLLSDKEFSAINSNIAENWKAEVVWEELRKLYIA